MSFTVIEVEDLGESPVRMTPEEGCLLADPVQGVAGYPPSSATSASCSCPQFGQLTVTVRAVRPFTRL